LKNNQRNQTVAAFETAALNRRVGRKADLSA
jgi:hypothetical protein